MWMADRGVKHMAFFSRTGTDNTSAARTVQALRDRGVEVMVLRGDITKFNHVQDAVAQASSALILGRHGLGLGERLVEPAELLGH